jgi:hypothetical protein
MFLEVKSGPPLDRSGEKWYRATEKQPIFSLRPAPAIIKGLGAIGNTVSNIR